MSNMLLAIRLLFFIAIVIFVVGATAKESITFQVSLTKEKTQLLLPVPNRLITTDAVIQLTEMDTAINIKYKVLNSWPTLAGKKYIRLLLIEVDQIPGNNLSLLLEWNNDKLKSDHPGLVVQENLSLVFPSSNWLAQALLLHPKSMELNSAWYVEPLSKYANYFTDQAALAKNGYPIDRASQWLYDKPQAIYQLFIMSGNKKWLEKADFLAKFYLNNIDENGLFKLINKNDVKYSMPKGLLYRYFLSADDKAREALTKVYLNSLAWPPEYNLATGFWTERNQAAALNTAISYWELTGDASALERINQIIDATVAMTFNPVNDWSLVGCPQHTYKSHEGQGGYSPTCSPWMMALLSDALWRYYLLTEDARAASLIEAFGDFVLNHGINWGDEKVGNIVIPKYLVALENPRYESNDQWTDHQHTCDVAGLLGKAVYIKSVNKVDDLLFTELFSVFIQQCRKSFELTNSKNSTKAWAFNPPRRFSWTFSSTSDLPWLVELLLTEE
mgnify:CR=1 FL=1